MLLLTWLLCSHDYFMWEQNHRAPDICIDNNHKNVSLKDDFDFETKQTKDAEHRKTKNQFFKKNTVGRKCRLT